MSIVDLNVDQQPAAQNLGTVNSDVSAATTVNLIWQISTDGLIEKDWIDFLFSEFTVNHIADPNFDVVIDNAIVITRGNPKGATSVKDYLGRFKQQGYQIGVLHLSDEWFTSPVDFYLEADFVFRNFYRPDVAHLPHVLFVPVGYKQGLHKYTVERPISDRQYYWSFAGQLGGKVSRRAMMEQAQNIPGGIAYVGKGYNDSQDLSFEGYVELICDTVFVLSPAGNRCAETSRFYEALEVGAIPVVEDVSKFNIIKQILKEILKPEKAKQHKVWTFRYWQDAISLLLEPSYWTQVFGPEFPCPKCSNWKHLAATLAAVDIEAAAKETQAFWQDYKRQLKIDVRTIVLRHFSK
ncbi:hypothetical protein [Halomicronema sp. CCY15110]|uniref:hypothetical protein n=1 Tax=Halomicronema sp. CCY15110 TaxID=2767773 RepID=UPI00194F0909|nr:hypothetical protein [Halomicronema sp. CCY15110]